MVAIVYGFPNKISALQFEHAWQHGYQTHYISEDERIVKAKNGGRSLHHKLGLIRLLLKHVFFQYMNLKVHFFNHSTKEMWDNNKFKIEKITNPLTVEEAEGALQDPKIQTVDDMMDHAAMNLELIKKFYMNYVAIDENACQSCKNELLAGEMPCGICERVFDYTSSDMDLKPHLAFCNENGCKFIAHLRCLHRYFLDDEQLRIGKQNLIPKDGKCPDCAALLNFSTVVKYSRLVKKFHGAN
ncbi:endonuclease NDAI_0F01890 [Naumovozyma dairenensis CBS 421]|uniref:Structure-specific endonuclease subunit SLX1 C-terminal domain-containing protein n=1 Tax=Naumovozyma dairenensis (strain ATCC 10597 / BCRC 20456 / CBS 421 / NBRC 0211 / NRRL Y-12639) TaxID=1071378 RepID=G0WCJ6_NAUDC|nr:hypothetical protein NDAI_0F01890 [Naumovozyma dairenensis CBS 421]CCD25507.1 hypothetical protein NDAI_0F01890 [Naumovozyma dairenensis CBS 421]